MDEHQNEGVKLSLDCGLTIKGKDSLAAKAVYQAEQLGRYLTNPLEISSNDHPCFSCEAFVVSLVEWIVTDDQVCMTMSFLTGTKVE